MRTALSAAENNFVVNKYSHCGQLTINWLTLKQGAIVTTKKIAIGTTAILLIVVLNLTFLQLISGTPDPSRAPGVAVGHEPAPSLLKRIMGRAQYVASPSLTILSDGSYVASHDLFGWGSSQNTAGIVKIYRSVDRGKSWVQTTTLEGQFWSTIFAHKDALYIIGVPHRGGNLIIRKSTDGGYTWTTPLNKKSGILKTGKFGGTPNSPVIHDGRLWVVQSMRLVSAPVGADLLNADSWTVGTPVRQNKRWLDSSFNFWSEGQVVASPAEGVVVLPKINQLPYTAILRAETPIKLTFDPVRDFVELPGAEKKFGAVYDPVSGRFYVCSNPVLPAHKNDPNIGETPAMIRNAAALFSSKDLRHWEMKKIFLYSPDLHHEAFQYLNFVIDGDDLAVISRTAFVIGGPKPPRGHDSNLMTFHRIKDFRNATREYELEIEDNRVLRYERTQHEHAPLGSFPLGSQFDGKPLEKPDGLAQDEEGHVYIREQSDRILQFDTTGNFQGISAAPPLQFETYLPNLK